MMMNKKKKEDKKKEVEEEEKKKNVIWNKMEKITTPTKNYLRCKKKLPRYQAYKIYK